MRRQIRRKKKQEELKERKDQRRKKAQSNIVVELKVQNIAGEIQQLKKRANNGVVFRKKYSRNSQKQRANIASVVLKPGGSLPGNPVKQFKKDIAEEAKYEEKISGMLREELHERISGDWNSTAEYYYASSEHQPPLPPVDEKLLEKQADGILKGRRQLRTVVASIVEVKLKSGQFRTLDSPDGVYVCNYLLKLPRVNGQTNQTKLYRELSEIEEQCFRQKKCLCRQDMEGERVAGLDGPDSCYITLGTTVNRRGKGMRTAKLPQLKEGRLAEFVKEAEGRCWPWLPGYVKDVLQMSKKHYLEMTGEDPLGVWPSLAIGRNNFMNVHVDRDLSWSMCCVVAEDCEQDAIVCYFVFPSCGAVVPLRNGDCLVFNSTVFHCISARCNPTRNSYYIGFYINAGMAGANNVEVPICESELEQSQWVLKTLLQRD